MKLKKEENGFTLVESLITLFISTLLIIIPVLSIDQLINTIEIDMFFRELSSNISLMQNYAILSGENTIVEFIPRENKIKFKIYEGGYHSNHPLNHEIELPDSVCSFYGNDHQTIYFQNNTGNISVAFNRWRVKFKTKNDLYELVFKLGSGRFDVRKIQNG